MDKAENEIIKLVLAGNRDAYRVLVESHYQFAFRIACRITGNAEIGVRHNAPLRGPRCRSRA